MESSVELMGEIAELEVEIIQLERFLLSLYQKAFGQHLPTLAEYSGTHSQCQIGTGLQALTNQVWTKLDPNMVQRGKIFHHQISSPNCWESTKYSDGRTAASPKALPAMNIPFKLQNSVYGEHLRDLKNPDLSRSKRADYFGADHSDVSFAVQIDSAVKLSEDMISCMSSIYCQLAEPPLAHGGHLASPVSSLSSSSTFSTQNHNDSWSPQCSEETTVHCHLLAFNEENGPYNSMLEVTEIHLNDERFKYASKMLQTFRSLVRRLENVDPRTMKHEEKLAFWINIHNALVMHAFLAYGTHNDQAKNATILKAAYNVGGHSINAYIIRLSILRIHPRQSPPWITTLSLSRGKSKPGGVKHVYAIENPEPLVHFALCLGAYSDPAVRKYTANNMVEELRLAREEFIRATIYINRDAKIFLPKIVCYYAKDMSFSGSGLLDLVNQLLPNFQRHASRLCKSICWMPQASTFRYLIHQNLKEEICM